MKYKNAKSMKKADVKYHVIQAWWLSSRVTIEDGMYILSTWLEFWHYRYRQWGGNMLIVGVLGILIVYVQITIYYTILIFILHHLYYFGTMCREAYLQPHQNNA